MNGERPGDAARPDAPAVRGCQRPGTLGGGRAAPHGQVQDAWDRIAAVPVKLHDLDDGPAVVAMTQRLERKSAYDAAYVVLADRLGTELWTLDGPLARNAGARELPVRLIESP